MTEVQLENTLFDFIEGQYDILVTTTIIETGVDIPNANTLFVENADYMGLSTLYQLRGRVGRNNRVCLFYVRTAKILNEVSETFRKRLYGIRFWVQNCDARPFHSSGNLLGAQQHGFIDSVGFDMYSQMLSEAVARKQGKISKTKTSVEIDLGIDAYIPERTLQTNDKNYKRIRQLENMDMYEELEADLLDRFGDPDEVAHLLTTGSIKMDGDRALLESIRKRDQKSSLC